MQISHREEFLKLTFQVLKPSWDAQNESLRNPYGGRFMLSTQLIKANCPTIRHLSLFITQGGKRRWGSEDFGCDPIKLSYLIPPIMLWNVLMFPSHWQFMSYTLLSASNESLSFPPKNHLIRLPSPPLPSPPPLRDKQWLALIYLLGKAKKLFWCVLLLHVVD